MPRNMGGIDRIIRLIVALVVAGLIITGVVQGVLAIILGVLAAIFVLTSAIGFCPLYAPFGLRTGPRS